MGSSLDGPRPPQERSKLSVSYITLSEEERLELEFSEFTDDQLRSLAQHSASLDPINEWLRRSDEKIKKLEKAFATVLLNKRNDQQTDGTNVEERVATIIQQLRQTRSRPRP